MSLKSCFQYGNKGTILPRTVGCPLLGMKQIKGLHELQPFFNTLASEIHNTMLMSNETTNDSFPKSASMPAGLGQYMNGDVNGGFDAFFEENPEKFIDEMIQNDFIEPLPKSQ